MKLSMGNVDKTVTSIGAAAPRPSIGDLVVRATEIRTFVREQAEQTEVNRQVSVEAIERMRGAGLFRIMTPAIYGGYEYGFDALVPVVAQVAAGCCRA
jgi:resorcinol 4-hydroxylase (FADH2)